MKVLYLIEKILRPLQSPLQERFCSRPRQHLSHHITTAPTRVIHQTDEHLHFAHIAVWAIRL